MNGMSILDNQDQDVDRLLEIENKAKQGTIKFTAAVWKVSTLADLGIRLVLDLPETAIPQMAMLAECHRQKMVLDFEATEHEARPEIERRAER